jgi:hypothetical protein
VSTREEWDKEWDGLVAAAKAKHEAEAPTAEKVRELEALRDDLAGKLKDAQAEVARLQQLIEGMPKMPPWWGMDRDTDI